MILGGEISFIWADLLQKVLGLCASRTGTEIDESMKAGEIGHERRLGQVLIDESMKAGEIGHAKEDWDRC